LSSFKTLREIKRLFPQIKTAFLQIKAVFYLNFKYLAKVFQATLRMFNKTVNQKRASILNWLICWARVFCTTHENPAVKFNPLISVSFLQVYICGNTG
jgi:hypothetical protein